MYGAVRLVLDIWEDYFQRQVEWHFSEHFARLELIPHLDWDNAQSGYGFIETGFGFDEDYGEHPFCLNFDILSHELGHSFVFALVGTPFGRVSAEYLGFQEAASDIVTLLSTLHFTSVVDHVLAENLRQHLRFQRAEPLRRAVTDASDPLRQQFTADGRRT